MKDDYAIGDDDPVYLDDVAMASLNYRLAVGTESRRLHKAYRDRLIHQCYYGGDVTRRQLARAAGLSLKSIDAIRRAGKPPWPQPKLRVVR